jgi:hypothetical protein
VTVVIIIAAIVLTVAVVAWFLLARKHPESAAGHPEPPRTGSAQFFGDPDDRPGGPGAESDGVAAPGEPAPGPSAETGDGPRKAF